MTTSKIVMPITGSMLYSLPSPFKGKRSSSKSRQQSAAAATTAASAAAVDNSLMVGSPAFARWPQAPHADTPGESITHRASIGCDQ